LSLTASALERWKGQTYSHRQMSRACRHALRVVDRSLEHRVRHGCNDGSRSELGAQRSGDCSPASNQHEVLSNIGPTAREQRALVGSALRRNQLLALRPRVRALATRASAVVAAQRKSRVQSALEALAAMEPRVYSASARRRVGTFDSQFHTVQLARQ
jgi:cytochrome P450